MDFKKIITELCEKRNTNYSAVARQIGTTKQNICNKFAKGKFYVDDLERIAAALGAHLEIKFIDNETNEPII